MQHCMTINGLTKRIKNDNLVPTKSAQEKRGKERAYNAMYGSCPLVPMIQLFLEHPAFDVT